MPVQAPITSPFGMRKHPITGQMALHSGIDLGAAYGTPIKAANGGRVIFAGNQGGFGNAIVIQHSSEMATQYGHCSKLLVKEGDLINQGQIIALVGSTGISTGTHLHFSVIEKGKFVDPLKFLVAKL